MEIFADRVVFLLGQQKIGEVTSERGGNEFRDCSRREALHSGRSPCIRVNNCANG